MNNLLQLFKRISNRRQFMKKIMLIGSLAAFGSPVSAVKPVERKKGKEFACRVFRAVNGAASENLEKVVELMGGIEKYIGQDDVVVIKPNLQWWNQGSPNLSAVKTFVEIVMNRPGGFNGEVILAENIHGGPTPWDVRGSGWKTHYERNSDLSDILCANDLCRYLKKRYGSRFSTVHWINVDAGGRRVYGPRDGAGSVYCDGSEGVPLVSYANGASGMDKREVIMTYPVFKSDKGTVIDFKNGIWENGSYTGQGYKFINFAALNHHSTYCGATSAVKNYLGVSDLSGGPDPHDGGRLTEKYYNFHSFPFDKWAPGPKPGMIGAEIGVFMNTIRKADLNITTAEWVGLASRIDPPVAQTRAVLASADPVALDYHATKYLLYPNSGSFIHNPEDPRSPVFEYLKSCADLSGCIFDERHVDITSYDFAKMNFQEDCELMVIGDKVWGSNLKIISKHLLLKHWPGLLLLRGHTN
jgi:hypothetical protein